MKKQLLSLFIALISLTAVAQTIPNYVPTNGLVSWYPFNGNVNDLSGNNLNANVVGATLTTDRNNVVNKAYNFDVTDATFGNQNDEIFHKSEFRKLIIRKTDF